MTHHTETNHSPEPLDDNGNDALTPHDIFEIAESEGKDSDFIASLTSFLGAGIDQGRITISQALDMLGITSIAEAKTKLNDIRSQQIEAARKKSEQVHGIGKKVLSTVSVLNPLRLIPKK